ncbi:MULTISPECIES: aromatic amino acid lyase [unclassified Streptomyces]|uniref:aromatic amino acid ammonia-lyase n=1 Tax=unclassified Streptomyces TaxID=2593676 RepID=UPI0037F9D402
MDTPARRIVLNGTALTVAELIALVDGEGVPVVDPAARERAVRSWHTGQRLAAAGRLYGRGTGVGAHRGVAVEDGDEAAHGLRLLRSHAGGAGALLPARQVRAMLAVRVNQLLAGGSGIHPDFVDALAEALRLGVHPAVNEYGGVGTGDLTALAQTGLTLLGERPWLPYTADQPAVAPSPGPSAPAAAPPVVAVLPASPDATGPGAGVPVVVAAAPPGGASRTAGGPGEVSRAGADELARRAAGSGDSPRTGAGPGDPSRVSGMPPDVPPRTGLAPSPGRSPESGAGRPAPAGVPEPAPTPLMGIPAPTAPPLSAIPSPAAPPEAGASRTRPGARPGAPSGFGSAPVGERPGGVAPPGPGGVAPPAGPREGAAPAGQALPRPVTLRAGDALALLSSNALALGQAALAGFRLGQLLRAGHAVAALSLAAVSGAAEAYAAPVHALRPYRGAARAAGEVRRLLGLPDRPAVPGRRIQDPFGFRAFPQVHGCALDAADRLREVVEVEINCPSENPLMDPGGTAAYHHGGFFAAPLGLALETANLALLQTAQLSAARLTALGDPALTGLTAFLATGPASSSGTMILEYTSHSALAEVRAGAAPASTGHAVLSHGLEEAASFAGQSARQTLRATEAYVTILACELVAAVRALRMHPVRPDVPAFTVAAAALPDGTEDRPLTGDVLAAAELLPLLAEL